jgi:hypothetical protein
VRRFKEHRASSPGFYTALGDTEAVTRTGELELRVYFHLTAAGAAPLIASVTRLLNDAEIPFSVKVLDDPAGFVRCDAGVLYLGDGDFERSRTALRAVVSTCAPHLRDQTPAFAKPLTRGVAVGEHLPSHGGSFGTSRCRFLAEGIVGAHERGMTRLSDRIEAVAERFAARELDLSAPYRVRHAIERYVL